MGRVLPGLTTRTGAISVADAVGTTKDQQLQNALRRASAQKAQARVEQSRDRMTPEGMLKFVGQAADTAGKVASTVGGIGGLIGKGLKALEIDPNTPVTQAMRKAAMAKATRETGGADKIAANIRSAFGQGPVAEETVTMLQRMSQSTDPNERIAAQQLLPEVQARAKRVATDQARSSLEQRAGALGYTPESLQEAIERGEITDAPVADLTRERAVIERSADPAQDVNPDEVLAARMAVADAEKTQQQRRSQAEGIVADMASGPEPTEIQQSLTEVAELSPEDRFTVAVESYAKTLGSDPTAARTKLLSDARGATTPSQQRLILEASQTVPILPEGTLKGISPFVDPREQFNKELIKQFPTSAQIGQAQRASLTAAVRREGIEQRRDAAAESADIRREVERGRNRRFAIKRGDGQVKFKAEYNRKINEFERRENRLERQLEVQLKRLDQGEQRLKDNRRYRGAVIAARNAANNLRRISLNDRRKQAGARDRFLLSSNISIMNRNLGSEIKSAQTAAKEARKAYNAAEKAVNKLAQVNENLTPADKGTQQTNYNDSKKRLGKRLKDVEKLERRASELEKKRNKMSSMLAGMGKAGLSALTDEAIMEFADLFADEEIADDLIQPGEE